MYVCAQQSSVVLLLLRLRIICSSLRFTRVPHRNLLDLKVSKILDQKCFFDR